jgi:hypothetical protein
MKQIIYLWFFHGMFRNRICSVRWHDYWMNWKGYGRKRPWYISRYHPGTDLEGLRKYRISSHTEYQRSGNANFVFLVRLTLFCPSYFTVARVCVPLSDSEPRKKIFKNLSAFILASQKGPYFKRQARICNYLYFLHPAVCLYWRYTYWPPTQQ